MSQLLQCLQWVYLHQSSALPAVSQYLVSQLPELVGSAGAGGVHTSTMLSFWSALHAAVKPPLPPMLLFTKERLTVPSQVGGHSFDQVRREVHTCVWLADGFVPIVQ
jgi:hypothetical protein